MNWGRLFKLVFFNPAGAFLDFYACAERWFKSRDWMTMISRSIPWVILFVGLSSLVILGAMKTNDALVREYLMSATVQGVDHFDITFERNELPSLESLSLPVGNDTPGIHLYRRILRLQPQNKTAKLFVANNFARTGEIGKARLLMESLAPSTSAGDPRAHAWLAQDLLRMKKGGRLVSDSLLKHHLGIGFDYGNLPVHLLFDYAKLLANDREEEKEKLFEVARRILAEGQSDFLFRELLSDPALPISFVSEMAVLGIQKAEEGLRKEENEADRSLLARAHALREDYASALDTIEGIQEKHVKQSLRRQLSTFCLQIYRRSLEASNGEDPRWSAFEQALIVDPANPAIHSEMLTIVYSNKYSQNGLLFQGLEKEVRSPQPFAAVRLVYARVMAKSGNLGEARSQLEAAHTVIPDSTAIMGSLSMLLAVSLPYDLERSHQLIERCLALEPKDPEILDILGKIYDREGSYQSAAETYQRALDIDPSRSTTKALFEQAKAKSATNAASSR